MWHAENSGAHVTPVSSCMLVVPSPERQAEKISDSTPLPSTQLFAPRVGMSLWDSFAIVPMRSFRALAQSFARGRNRP